MSIKSNFKTIAKWIVIAVAIAHLIFVPIHVSALLKLENELCGLIMFLFVLFGLVALFNAVRLNKVSSKALIFNIVTILLTIGLGIYLTSIYFEAITIQNKLETGLVYRAIALSIIVMVGYAVSIIFLLLARLKKH